jgi:hypothetical protein
MTLDAKTKAVKQKRITDYVEALLDSWPPLSQEQRSKLAELLRPVRIHDGA